MAKFTRLNYIAHYDIIGLDGHCICCGIDGAWAMAYTEWQIGAEAWPALTEDFSGKPCDVAVSTSPPRWIVVTKTAKTPRKSRGEYRRVAVVLINGKLPSDFVPAMISERARGVLKIEDLGTFHVGKTARSSYRLAVALANEKCDDYNSRLVRP